MRKKKIGWLLLGNKSTGSSRIHGINVHNYLIEKGLKSKILQTNDITNTDLTLSSFKLFKILFSGYDTIIFQKLYGKRAQAFAKICKTFSIKTILVQCDLINSPMISIVDEVIVTSEYLKKYYKSKYNINPTVIDDAIETNYKINKFHKESETLKVVWVGHLDNWFTLDIIKQAFSILNNPNIVLTTISNHAEADIKWDINTIEDNIRKHDIAVIPSVDTDWSKAKSTNRLTMFMSMGIPIVSSDIPAYRSLLVHNETGLIANTPEEWAASIKSLTSPDLRNELSSNAFKKVIPYYTIEYIGKKWINVIQK